jgi:hypothetical protein
MRLIFDRVPIARRSVSRSGETGWARYRSRTWANTVFESVNVGKELLHRPVSISGTRCRPPLFDAWWEPVISLAGWARPGTREG